MAEIISISLNKEILEDMGFIQKKLGFSGRSEIVRAGLRTLIEEHKKLSEITGIIEGTIVVTHHEKHTEEFSKIKHSAHHSVKTHIHHELEEHNCMEILLFKGDAMEIKALYQKFISSRKIDSVKVILP
jgi:CopG family nickel-responsive transcriptional regulator